MARIFTINFFYKTELESAIISVRTTPFFTEYTINPMDEEIMEKLPLKKIISSAPGQFSFVDFTKEQFTPLMKNIIEAIAQHLQPATV
jgi:hypothetical protein